MADVIQHAQRETLRSEAAVAEMLDLMERVAAMWGQFESGGFMDFVAFERIGNRAQALVECWKPEHQQPTRMWGPRLADKVGGPGADYDDQC